VTLISEAVTEANDQRTNHGTKGFAWLSRSLTKLHQQNCT